MFPPLPDPGTPRNPHPCEGRHVFICYGSCNESSRTWRVKTTHVYSLRVPEVRVSFDALKPRWGQSRFFLQGLGATCIPWLKAPSSPSKLVTPASASILTSPSLFCGQTALCLRLMRTCVTPLSACPESRGTRLHLKSDLSISVPSVKSLRHVGNVHGSRGQGMAVFPGRAGALLSLAPGESKWA